MKKFVVTILLAIFLEAEAPPQIKTILLPEVVVEAKSYDREIFDEALRQGADSLTSRLIVAQARLESGDYKNALTRHHNNVFSMQHPRKRKTTSLGPFASAEKRKNRYASYASVRDSVTDLFLYFKAKKIRPTQPSLTRYVKTLKSKGFFEDPEVKYKKGLKKKINQITV